MTMENLKKDPQIIVQGKVKVKGDSETIVFSFSLGPWFLITCIVSMPYEGRTYCPVYVKFGTKTNGEVNTDTVSRQTRTETTTA